MLVEWTRVHRKKQTGSEGTCTQGSRRPRLQLVIWTASPSSRLDRESILLRRAQRCSKGLCSLSLIGRCTSSGQRRGQYLKDAAGVCPNIGLPRCSMEYDPSTAIAVMVLGDDVSGGKCGPVCTVGIGVCIRELWTTPYITQSQC